MYCISEFGVVPKEKTILRLIQRIKDDSNLHIFRTLLSILWGLYSAEFIRGELIEKVYSSDAAELYECIDAYMNAVVIESNTS
jgi:hypothetical protein